MICLRLSILSNLQWCVPKLIIDLLLGTGDVGLMRVNVAQQLKEGIGSTRSYDIDEVIDLDVEGDERGGLVRGEVKLTRTNRGILATGELHTTVKIDCSRCLSEYECPLDMNFEEEFFPLTDVLTGAPLPLPDDPDAFTIDAQHILDMTEAIRQSVVLAMPMKPLCRDDCAGLCPECGQNLNEGLCNCQVKSSDPRWEKLSRMLVTSDRLLHKEEGK